MERRFFGNRALAIAGARIFHNLGCKLGSNIEHKSIPKWVPRWNASWHRFLNDFAGFWVPSWDAKSIKNRLKITSKKRCKKQSRLGRVLGRLRADKGAATYSDPVRRDPTGPNGTQRAGNPLLGAARAAALSRKNTN